MTPGTAVAEHAIDRWVERVAPTASRDAALAAILRYAATTPDGGRTRKGDRVLVGEHRGVPFGLVVRLGPPPGKKVGRRGPPARQTIVTVLGPDELEGDHLLSPATSPDEPPDAPPDTPDPDPEARACRGRWRRAALTLAAAIVDGSDPAAAFAAALEAQPRLVEALAAERGLA